MWSSQSPLRQFKGLPAELLTRLEKKDLAWERYYDLKPSELGDLIRMPKYGKALVSGGAGGCAAACWPFCWGEGLRGREELRRGKSERETETQRDQGRQRLVPALLQHSSKAAVLHHCVC